MDTNYYLGFDDDAKDRALLGVLDRNEGKTASKLKRTLWVAASTLALAVLAVGAYIAAPSESSLHSPSSAVLLSDQYSTYGDTTTTTTTTPTTPTGVTDVYGNEIPEGRAVKCGLLKLEYFRFTNGERHWYPTAAIAYSWDPGYLLKFSVVDCGRVPRGADMGPKLPSPSLYPEGQAIKCDASQSEVYRLTGGKRCWYPTSAIATSWDSLWSKFAVVDCSALPRGNDMQLNPKGLPDGQSIKCSATASTFFRLVGGHRCAYPTNTIAASWDVNWSAGLAVDCSVLPVGVDIQLNPKVLPEGHAIKCGGSSNEIFRLVGGKRCRYPTSEIAFSWDRNYLSTATSVDCTVVTQGPDLCHNPKNLPEGQAIKCSASAPEVYRLVAGGKYRWYPNPAIATSWDSNWSAALVVDCSVLVKGDDICTHPKSLPNGKTIKCEGKSDLYRLENGARRLYPSLEIATSWDADCSTKATVVDCSVLGSGDDMCFNQPTLVNGQAIKCLSVDPSKVFRFCDELVRWYPTSVIADSWDANWKTAVLADCSKFQLGPDMAPRAAAATPY
jgi:hypothetical protein